MWLNLGKVQQKCARVLPPSVEFGCVWPNFSTTLTKIGQQMTKSGEPRSRWANFDRLWPKSSKHWPKSDQIWPELVNIELNAVNIGQTTAQIGQTCPTSAQIGPPFANTHEVLLNKRCRKIIVPPSCMAHILAAIGPIWVEVDRCRASIGRVRAECRRGPSFGRFGTN